MSIATTIKAALLGSLLAVPTVVRAEVAADPNCWRADETEAARFEDFRLKILVGALNCKNYLPGAAASYNNFLQAKKDFILANMYVVRGHFAREAGATAGADNFANYETLAGNRYSAPTFDRAKCETVDAYARLAAGLSDADLTKFVDSMSSGPLPSGCKPAARPVVPVAVVAVAAPPPALAPASVMLAAVPSVPVLVPAVASLPVTVAPMTDAQRVAASTVATRQLLASRAAQANLVTVPVVTAAPAVVSPAVAMVAPAPVEVAAVTAPVVVAAPAPVPAALLVVKADPAPAAIPATLIVAKPEPAPVALKADVPAPVRASGSQPAVALALAEAAKALAVAAAAMAQTGTN